MKLQQAEQQYRKALIDELNEMAELYGDIHQGTKVIQWENGPQEDEENYILFDAINNKSQIKHRNLPIEEESSWLFLIDIRTEEIKKLHDYVSREVLKEVKEVFRNREVIDETINILTEAGLAKNRLQWVKEKLYNVERNTRDKTKG